MTAAELADELARRLGARRVGSEYIAPCPAHADEHPSFYFREKAGQFVVTCRAKCNQRALWNALRAAHPDLFASWRNERPAQAGPASRVTPYEIRDAAGVLVAMHVRKDYSDGRPKGFSWQQPDGTPGLNGIPAAELPLYGSEHLAKLPPGAGVILCEGEKATDAVRSLELPALGTVTGASGCPSPAVLKFLHGRRVILWLDADEPGRQHMDRVARALSGIASEVRLLTWGEPGPRADAADFVVVGGTREQLIELVKAAPRWEPDASPQPEASATAKDEDWPSPLPLRSVDVPPFPVEALPGDLRAYVEAVSLATQTPADLSAFVVLAVLATAAAKHAVIEAREDWREPLNLFAGVVLAPGNRKSAVFRECTAPLAKYQTEEARRLGPEVRLSAGRRDVAEKALERAKAEAAKATEDERQEKLAAVDRLTAELAALPVVTVPRLYADDVTPEALAALMAENGERMAVLSAEGGIFGILAGRYQEKGGPNLDVFAKGHTGDVLDVDRIGRDPVHMDSPALTVGLAVQPDVIRALADTPEFRGRGLLGRFLYALPLSPVGSRLLEPPAVPAATRERYAATVRAILRLVQADGEAGPEPHVLTLSGEAAAAFRTFRAWLEPQSGPGGELASVADWALKLAGAVARIAGLLHLAEHAGERQPWAAPVSAETMGRAVTIGHYLIPHARAAFAQMGADGLIEDAEHVLGWIRRNRQATFTKRDLFNGTRTRSDRFRTANKLDRPLGLLVDYGFIRELPREDREGPGRKPSPGYEVNPATVTQNPHNPQNYPPGSNCADSADCAGLRPPEPVPLETGSL